MVLSNNTLRAVGIDDISVYIPSLFLDIADLAEARGIAPAKLQKGLGLQTMAVPDASEDVVTMAAEALIDLVAKNDLQPEDIGRIYVGTESMVDGSKPIASYLVGILHRYYEQQEIDAHSLRRCDAVDLTFACIGAVDAMHNSLDWIRLHPEKKAIVISTDWAKYDLNEPGEYTQGAGAVAMLLTSEPRLMVIDDVVGVSTESVHDFYKPHRLQVRYEDIVASNGVPASFLGREIFAVHKETPVYDGQFSNTCYRERVTDALADFTRLVDSEQHPFDSWSRMIFHLPYAYHARRIFVTMYIDYLKDIGTWEEFLDRYDLRSLSLEMSSTKEFLKAVSKTDAYKTFIEKHIASGEELSSYVGNVYTGSIFLSLLSCLYGELDTDLSNTTLGFFAYGSGSKSKVFQGTPVEGYQQLVERLGLEKWKSQRKQISFHEYEYLHRHKLMTNLDSIGRKVFQVSSGWTSTNKYARNYDVVIA